MPSLDHNNALADEAKDLERRSYQTYRARMVAAQRLTDRHNAWSSSLLAVTTGAVIASISTLVVPSIYGSFGGALLAALSVLTLAVSLATTGLNYSGRTRDMFLNYRKFQRISVEAENMLRLPREELSAERVHDLQKRYQATLDESENHTQADYEISYGDKNKLTGSVVYMSRAMTLLPYALLAFPVALLVPIVFAALRGFS